jgi:hypothetical protein
MNDDGYIDLDASYATEDARDVIPDSVSWREIADDVVRGKRTLSRDQMRLLIELLPYHMPKLSATTHVNFSLADALEKALERAWGRSANANVPRLNGPVPQLDAAEMKKPMQRYRRF